MTQIQKDFSAWKKQKLKNPKFKTEYEKFQPEFALIRAMIDMRIKQGFTQVALAKRVGTKQSVISRLERGHGNPTVSFLKKMADAFSSHLEIRFIQ
jgi:predicted transcriptional regulator